MLTITTSSRISSEARGEIVTDDLGHRPPAVPLVELLDALDGTTPEPVSDRIVIRHPLQPFDVRNVTRGALGMPADTPFTFDPTALTAAEAASADRGPEPDSQLRAEGLTDTAHPGAGLLVGYLHGSFLATIDSYHLGPIPKAPKAQLLCSVTPSRARRDR